MIKFNAEVDKASNVIAPEIYGHFAEHLGRCIYGGLFVGEDSKIENEKGMRRDVVDALKNIKVPVLRWPGGCFADTYHWRDGIGNNRKKIVNTCWGDVVEDNSFGTHEYFELCEQLGCKTYVNGNVGTGTLQEMCEWIEYMTFGGESPLSLERATNGHKNPWHMDYFGVGNEAWGYGGNMTPEYYGGLYRHYQCFLKNYDTENPYKKVCVGPTDFDYRWTEEILNKCYAYPHPEGRHGFMDVLSIHYYVIPGTWDKKGSATEFSREEYYCTVVKASKMDEILTKNKEILAKYDPEGKISLTVDEWGCWLDVEPGTNPGFLYQQNTMRDAIVASLTLDIFNKHADRVKMACLAQMVNVLQAVVLTDDEKMIMTPTYHVFDMYKHHQGATYIPVNLEGSVPAITSGGDTTSSISATLSKNADGEFHLTITNADLDTAQKVELEIEGIAGKNAQGRVLEDVMDAYNTFEEPYRVAIKVFSGYKVEGNVVSLTLAPCSITEISFK